MEIVPGVHRVPGTRGSNIYLIRGDQAGLIDTGLPGNAPAVLSYLQSLDLRPDNVQAILLTHRHGDHSGSLEQCRAATRARTMAHPGDAVLRKAAGTAANSGRPALLSKVWTYASGRVAVDEALEDGQEFPQFRGLQVVHVPGHTPGSVAFWLPDQQVLFTGDTVLSHGHRLSRPLGRPGQHDELERSLARLAALAPQIVAPGHGVPVSEQAAALLRELVARRPAALPLRMVKNWRKLLRFSQDLSRRQP